jgi:hypothetical protein
MVGENSFRTPLGPTMSQLPNQRAAVLSPPTPRSLPCTGSPLNRFRVFGPRNSRSPFKSQTSPALSKRAKGQS